MPQESPIESREHQDDSNIHQEPFPESVFEEREIDSGYDGRHRHHVKHDSYLSAHVGPRFNRNTGRVVSAGILPLKAGAQEGPISLENMLARKSAFL
jgi:hypothetical protein